MTVVASQHSSGEPPVAAPSTAEPTTGSALARADTTVVLRVDTPALDETVRIQVADETVRMFVDEPTERIELGSKPSGEEQTQLLPLVGRRRKPTAARPAPVAAPADLSKRRSRGETALISGLLLVVGVVQGWNILDYPAISDDEGTYLAQGWAVATGEGLAHYTYWYDHPPFAWMQLAALRWLPALLLPDTLTVASARFVMLLVAVVSAALLYVLARRHGLRAWTATLAVVLFSLSPLAVTMQRQIYLDNFAVMWVLAAFVLARSPQRNLWHHAAAGTCAALAVLSKETIAIVLPALVVALWQGSHPSTRKFTLTAFVCTIAPLIALYPLYALLNGELFPGDEHVSLLGALLFQVKDRAGSGSFLHPGDGARQLLDSWLYQDPVIVLAGVVAVALALASRRLRAPAIAGVILVLMAIRPNGYLPAMYVIQVLPFFALCLAGLVGLAAAWSGGRRRPPLETPAWLRCSAPSRLRLQAPSRLRFGAPAWLIGAVDRVAAGAWSRLVAEVAIVLAAVAVVAPWWAAGHARAATDSANDGYAAAVNWIDREIPDKAAARILVDDAIWLDLVEDGFTPGTGAIWFYKADLDPAVAKTLPNGWRDVDWVVSSPIVRQEEGTLPTVDGAVAHSTPMAVFGTGDDRIEVRKVTR
jgi:4-amino-4-deoxy-L-arabinose transferase-like glycosyltransferase